MRLRFGGSATSRGFAPYLADTDEFEDSVLLADALTGTPDDLLDCACERYPLPPTSDHPPTQHRRCLRGNNGQLRAWLQLVKAHLPTDAKLPIILPGFLPGLVEADFLP